MGFSKLKNFIITGLMLVLFSAIFPYALFAENYFAQPAAVAISQIKTAPVPLPPPEKLENPPEIIKAVYVTGWSAGNKLYLNYLSNLFKNTEINSAVVDIKDYSGKISYKSGMIENIDNLIRFLHKKNIYVIGRISVFEDPEFSKDRPDLAIYDKIKNEIWQDNNKLSWLDPASREVWDYNISLAKDALLHGFDEINFDYIRFPSDGKTQNMSFPFYNQKTPARIVLKNFFEYLRQELPNEKISADLFGQTTTSADDMGIGQIFEDALPYFDYVCPMIYPSHYAVNFMGFKNPADHPYEVASYSMATALARKNNSESYTAKIRPWLQDFNMKTVYTTDMVKQQIQATEDSLKEDFTGYMLWNPSNIYHKDAVK